MRDFLFGLAGRLVVLSCFCFIDFLCVSNPRPNQASSTHIFLPNPNPFRFSRLSFGNRKKKGRKYGPPDRHMGYFFNSVSCRPHRVEVEESNVTIGWVVVKDRGRKVGLGFGEWNGD